MNHYTSKFVADPDFVVIDDGKPEVVGDCKYKVLAETDLHGDVYQLTSHCQSIRCKKAILIFPGDAFSTTLLGTTPDGILVRVFEIRLPELATDLNSVLKIARW